MRLSIGIFTLILGAASISAYTPNIRTATANCLDHALSASRRDLLKSVALAAPVLLPLSAMADEPSLFDQFGTDSKSIKQAPKAVSGEKMMVPKSAGAIDPNLRANYYYPTARKRYLPRIKKASDQISTIPDLIASSSWSEVKDFSVKVADDTVLPMKLYTSSLAGQGLNLKSQTITVMTKSAEDFDKYNKQLSKAADKKDVEKSVVALQKMSVALSDFRTEGKLLGPDGGGDIPSVEDIRRSGCRVQGRSFEKKITDRDEKLKNAGGSPIQPSGEAEGKKKRA
ncbi:hypothetical protein TrLO_g6425 [Triparma laevis f. longispina]|uniref:Uncharacterized protein n=1 Tax=Triparma laevis f. longispina TaxID=1714387 RepID=A0A9W6ZN88_9STRA|nr:hypothetical protein TrLO_g6425 [Triparma laevis f. longispina]